jgi:hypothetical protein
MRWILRLLIIVVAMIAGGWMTGELAARFYVPYASPDGTSCGLAAGMFTMFILMPAGAIESGCAALLLTGTSKKPIIALLVVPGFVFVLWLLLGL